jgi:uncharacterized MAPEG superfamily protein
MSSEMRGLSPEMFWTVLTAGLASVMWMPHVVQRLLEKGIVKGFRDPTHEAPTKAAWAQRAIRAHVNAVENLVVFAVLATAIQLSGKGTAATALAAEFFFFTRAAHYVIYALGLPWLRVCAFLIGFVCQIILFVALMG